MLPVLFEIVMFIGSIEFEVFSSICIFISKFLPIIFEIELFTIVFNVMLPLFIIDIICFVAFLLDNVFEGILVELVVFVKFLFIVVYLEVALR